MALIIPALKLGKVTIENAYAKVGRVVVDNNSEVASFVTSIHKSKEDDTIVDSIRRVSFNFVDGSDIVEQCYNALKSELSSVEGNIYDMQLKVDADTLKTNRKAIWDLSVLKADSIFKIKNSIDDI